MVCPAAKSSVPGVAESFEKGHLLEAVSLEQTWGVEDSIPYLPL